MDTARAHWFLAKREPAWPNGVQSSMTAITAIHLLSLLSAVVFVSALGFRLLWRHRYGPTGVEGHYLRLRGTVVNGQPAGHVVYRRGDSPEPFDLETRDGQRHRVDPSGGQLVVHGRQIRVGDRVVLDATHGTVRLNEALYRESVMQPAVTALRLVHGDWPALRWLDEVATVAAVTLVVALLAQIPAPPHRPAALACPTGAIPGGERGRVQWCEVNRGRDHVVGAQESIKHGPWIVWWNQHRIRQIGWYERGKLAGHWVTWHPNGRKAVSANYRDSARVGAYATYRTNGTLRERGRHDDHGRRDGVWIDRASDGRLELLRTYRAGRPHGIWAGYFNTGKLAYRQVYRDGELHGPWQAWSVDGLAEAGSYVQGRKQGRWATYHDNGKLQRRGEYRDDRREGAWTFWHDDGRVMASGSYASGKPDGHWRWWHDHGQRAGTGRYAAGVKQGRWIAWDKDGRMNCQGAYRDDEKVGRWRGSCDGDTMAVLVGY